MTPTEQVKMLREALEFVVVTDDWLEALKWARAALAATTEPAPDFNPLTCDIIPGDYNGPHGPLPWSKEAEMRESWASKAPTYSTDDLRKVAEVAVVAQRNKTTAYIGARIGMDAAPATIQLGGTSPLADIDAIIAKATR